MYIFATPPVRLKLGTTNSKPPGPIIMIDQSKIRITMRSYFLHSSLAGAQRCCAFNQPQQTEQTCRRKTISRAKPANFDFPSPDFNVQRHILSTSGDTLTAMM
jgi:hypothetical protein